MSRTGRSKEAVERLGYMSIYEKKKKKKVYVFKPYEQVAIIYSDIYIRQQVQYILGSTEEYAFGAVEKENCPAKKYNPK